MPRRKVLDELAETVRKGSERDFTELYITTEKTFWYYIIKQTKNQTDAEEIFLNSQIEIWKNIKFCYSLHNFLQWAFRIISNNIKFTNRKNDPAAETEDYVEAADANIYIDEKFLPEKCINDPKCRQNLMLLFDSLPSIQKSAVLLYFFAELSVDEIAVIENANSETIKLRLGSAIEVFKNKISEHRETIGSDLPDTVFMPIVSLFITDMMNLTVQTASSDGLSVFRQCQNEYRSAFSADAQIKNSSAVKIAVIATAVLAAVAAILLFFV